MSHILDKIVAKKREEVESLSASQSGCTPSRRDFCHAISTQKTSVSIIAEIKRATPFKGNLLAAPVDARQWAKTYEDTGAAAISVLTDETFFKGSIEDLDAVAEKSLVPVLCKDFFIDAKQIFQARRHGADAILLILKILTDEQVVQFKEIAEALHMRALMEVHDIDEVERALTLGSRLIGINNRNLETGQTNLAVTEELIREIPRDIILVSESGIETPEDVLRLNGLVDAVLVGTTIMKASRPEVVLKSLVDATAV